VSQDLDSVLSQLFDIAGKSEPGWGRSAVTPHDAGAGFAGVKLQQRRFGVGFFFFYSKGLAPPSSAVGSETAPLLGGFLPFEQNILDASESQKAAGKIPPRTESPLCLDPFLMIVTELSL